MNFTACTAQRRWPIIMQQLSICRAGINSQLGLNTASDGLK